LGANPAPAADRGDPYAAVASFYDLEYGDYDADLTLYLELARRTGGPVLELGCGTGRVALALARAGYDVVGLDSSPAMLARAEAKLTPKLRGRIRLVRADMADFELAQSFGLIIIPLGTFGHLTTAETRLQCLAACRRHLRPGGLLGLDLPNPLAPGFLDDDPALVLHRVWVDGDRTLTKFVCRRVDPVEQVERVTCFYDEGGPGGGVKRTVFTYELAFLFRREAEYLLGLAGFDVEQVWGDYDLGPYHSAADRMFILARRRD
jgi:SAM-dependent methyltransferase